MPPRARGRPRHPDVLTAAEWRAVDGVRHGLTDRTIARLRGVSPEAIRFHVRNALAKLDIRRRAGLRAWAGVPVDSPLSTQEAITVTSLGSIGQIARTVRDVEESVAWYGAVLGLRHLYTFGPLAFFDCDGTRLFLSQVEQAKTDESLIYFRVPDVHSAHQLLLERGARFRSAPHLVHRHDDGTEEWMAFFDDPEGRPLAIMAQVPPDGRPAGEP